MSYRISVDTGGTFTDVVVADSSGSHTVGKSLTTPDRIFEGMRNAIANAAEQLDVNAKSLLDNTEVFIYGTTRSTNAIVTGNTARTAMLLTEGFPDTLVLREGGKFDPHDYSKDYPDPYVPRRHTYEVPERINSEGEVVRALDEEVTRELLRGIAEKKFEAIAVCLFWSIVNPTHEQAVGKLIEEIMPGIPYTLSHQLIPIVREYRRASTTVIDASLKPLMQEHLMQMEKDLRAAGFAGEILISTSSGGCMHVEELIERPIFTVKSGPAMAPVAGRTFAATEDFGGDVIICDTGGTTFDVGLVRDGELKYTRETWLGGQYTGHLIANSSVDMRSIGAGGGSIAWIDAGGLLQVGPQSAGAVPGPACYGNDGEEPTVTDAALVLGYIDPEYFLGGKMPLDLAAARRVVGALGEKLNLSPERTAYSIMTLANELMIKAIQDITVSEGFNPQESAIVAGGGAAGLNIMPIARELGCNRVILPRTASALSACGMQYSDIQFEYSASRVTTSRQFDSEGVNAALDTIDGELNRFVGELGDTIKVNAVIDYTVEARYYTQVWELDVPLPVERFRSPADIEKLVNAFHEVHDRVLAVRDEQSAVECLNWKGRVRLKLDRPEHEISEAATQSAGKARTIREAWFGGETAVPTPTYHEDDVPPGAVIEGPAVIELPNTTVVVYPGMRLRTSSAGNYLLEVMATDDQEQVNESSGGKNLDPVLMAVLANRFDGIVREMTNTLLRAARSAVIAVARDFSCALTTGDNRLLASAEGAPVHIFGSHMQSASMCRIHGDAIRDGDAYLHNDPYDGNSHAADQTVLVPVFFEGEHLFTACAKAHQADIGNSVPTTYHATARDVYEEGALIFPCVLLQRDGKMVDDVIRMGMRRIRVPEQWYGDLLAALGAARIAERRLKGLCEKYGRATVKLFIEEWFAYSERRMIQIIRELPKTRVIGESMHDPVEGVLPEGALIRSIVEIDPDEEIITIDLRENPDNQPCGFNLTEATSINESLAGLFHGLKEDIPRNAGSFGRINVLLRDGAMVGRPEFPFSCSMATTNVADRLVNATVTALAQLGDGFGLAEGGTCMSAAVAVVSGKDHRHGGVPYVNQLMLQCGGGPGSASADGWVNYGVPAVSGVLYKDSIELDEVKHPMHFEYMRLMCGVGGAGRFRGSPGLELEYGPKRDPMTVVIPSDCQLNPPKGVLGGHCGIGSENFVVGKDGTLKKLPNVVVVEVQAGENIKGIDASGGGYGDPLDRDPKRVVKDVLEGWETEVRALKLYGVVLTGKIEDETLAFDLAETKAQRERLRAAQQEVSAA
jgi:N-methylhydantoinase A/oxoprolinase/acetone carboxylase beta subunit/N-methylhydantoinase B/oxoprolinase/acetone carboxylase alpha subunit